MNRKMGILLSLSGLLLVLYGCSGTPLNDGEDTVSQATIDRYREAEIREYQGQDLSPAIGPRDNSIAGVQTVDIDSYELRIYGLVENEKVLDYAEVIGLDAYQRLITLYCVEGWDATILWEGVLLAELIDMAQADPKAVTVIFHSVDGYTTSLPLEVIQDKELILAYKSNGLDLPPEMGYPFIVVAEEKLGYKWARWVNGIELSSDADYEGFWESRGYDNQADLN